jgi:hypothetical protein
MVNTQGEEIGEPETFRGQVYELGQSLVITIPKETCIFAGIKKADWIKVWLKKTELKKEGVNDGEQKRKE